MRIDRILAVTAMAFLFASTPARGEIDESTLADSDGDGIGLIDDNCPVLASANLADADADGVGDACDVYTSPTPPRLLLEQAIGLAAIPTPSCMTEAVDPSLWIDDFRLADDDRARLWLSCEVRYYGALVQAADEGVPNAASARDLAGAGLLSLGWEKYSWGLSRGLGGATAPQADDRMQRALHLLTDATPLVEVAHDPSGAGKVATAWRHVQSASVHDQKESTKDTRGRLGTANISSKTTMAPGCPACDVSINYMANDQVKCDEIAFIQAVGVFDGNKPIYIGRSEEQDRATDDGWLIDRLDFRKADGVTPTGSGTLAYYSIKDDDTPGGHTKVGPKKASMDDAPCVAGANLYCFETCAVCRKGMDKDKLLQCYKWGCKVNRKGEPKLKKFGKVRGLPKHFQSSVDKWNAAAMTAGNKNNGKTKIPALTPPPK